MPDITISAVLLFGIAAWALWKMNKTKPALIAAALFGGALLTSGTFGPAIEGMISGFSNALANIG